MRWVLWTFSGIAFGIGMRTDVFQSCGHCWVFQISWHNEFSTLTASSFRIQLQIINFVSCMSGLRSLLKWREDFVVKWIGTSEFWKCLFSLTNLIVKRTFAFTNPSCCTMLWSHLMQNASCGWGWNHQDSNKIGRSVDRNRRERDPNPQIRLAVGYSTFIFYVRKGC